jgi:hypothetical protein
LRAKPARRVSRPRAALLEALRLAVLLAMALPEALWLLVEQLAIAAWAPGRQPAPPQIRGEMWPHPR